MKTCKFELQDASDHTHFIMLFFLFLYFHLSKQLIGRNDLCFQEQEDYQQHSLACYGLASAS